MLLKCGDGDMMQVMTTLGVDYSAKNLAGPGQTTIRLNLWDVAGFLKNWQKQITKMVNGDGIGHDLIKKPGQERYRVLSRAYLRGCQVDQ